LDFRLTAAALVYAHERMAAHAQQPVRGRAKEPQALDRLLANVRGGQSGVLVIRGEPGMGKTALARYARCAGVWLSHRRSRGR